MSGGADNPGEDAASSPDVPPETETLSVRVRGIYTTALTALLHDSETDGVPIQVVQASEPIRERFDAEFPVAPADATVATTDERQGVGISGAPWAVVRLRDRLGTVGRDALAWDAALPAGAVYQGVVTDTLGNGAVVDCGPASGYLPFSNTDDYVHEGDVLRVQVRDPRPPWDDDRPELGTGLVVDGGLVELRRGGSGGPGSASSEAARMAEMLPTDVPDGWAPRWDSAADDADLDALSAALSRAVDRVETVTAALGEVDPDEAPGQVVAPEATVWCWYGRESRFALDDHRRGVTATMPGHHRTKAADYAASAAVDFAEAVCGDLEGGFPFAAVTRQFGPREGDRLALHHGKPDGRLITLGRGEVTDYDPEGSVTVRRQMTAGGTYDALGVEREAGDVAITTLNEGRWWYPTVYRSEDGSRRGTYVNICTPVELFPDAARYVDLHVDVVKTADGTVRRVDDDELDDAVGRGHVSQALADKARQVATAVENAL
jgi:protein associated with RNAse G/E